MKIVVNGERRNLLEIHIRRFVDDIFSLPLHTIFPSIFIEMHATKSKANSFGVKNVFKVQFIFCVFVGSNHLKNIKFIKKKN